MIQSFVKRCFWLADLSESCPLNKLNIFLGLGSLAVLKPSGHYIYHQFNIQQFYVLPHTVYLCVLCGSENKQQLFPYTALTHWFFNRDLRFAAQWSLYVPPV